MSEMASARDRATPASRSLPVRLWEQHCRASSLFTRAETDPRIVLPMMACMGLLLVLMHEIPAARRFTGFEHQWPTLTLLAAATATTTLLWRFWERPRLRVLLNTLDALLYCLAVTAAVVSTSGPTRYVFGLVYGQMATDYGRRSGLSVPYVVGLSVLPVAFSLFALPDYAIVALMLFGALMYPFSAYHHDKQRQLRLQNLTLRSERDNADRVASLSMDLALAATLAEVGGFLHHHRNALTPVVGALRLLERSGRLGDKERDALATARRNLDKSCELSDRLFSTIRSRASMPDSWFEVAEVLEQAAQQVRDASDGGPTIAVETGPATLEARGNPEHLRLAVENLLRNAAEAGASRVTVTLSSESGGRLARVAVADDGPGMPEEVQRAVFESPVTLGKQNGHGLGLYLTRRLLELFGGRIQLARSAPAQGTCFEIQLPVQEKAVHASGPGATVAD